MEAKDFRKPDEMRDELRECEKCGRMVFKKNLDKRGHCSVCRDELSKKSE